MNDSTARMTLAAGTRLGAYQIVGPLGAGGMGDVYKARDDRLERTVAVKVVPPHVADDPVARQRFEREARVLAALSHPHICRIFDVGHAEHEQGGIDFLVMEYLEGETLAGRLSKGRLPFAEALRCAIDLADGLDQAHRRGVVHRDLKPGNIMMTPEGVKIVDFGVAKRIHPTRSDEAVTASAPAASLTDAGGIIGTLQYMAPEQLEGQDADARADIFALGVVLYEMLAGKKAFDGKTQAGLIGSIMRDDPTPLSTLLPSCPPALDPIVKTCLAKDPDHRWHTAGDVGRQLKWVLEGGTTSGAAALVLSASRSRRTLAIASTAAVLAAAAFGIWALRHTPESPAEVSRLLLTPAPSAPLKNVGGIRTIISPDGKRIVYVGAKPDGGTALYVRALSALDARMIPGTDLPPRFAVANPFFTEDGESVVFRSPGVGIIKVSLNGGPPTKVADDSPRYLGGGPGPDNTLLLGLGDGIYRATASGGTIERLTQPENPRILFAGPKPIAGTKLALFDKVTVPEGTSQVVLLDLETREQHVLIDGGGAAYYLPSGQMVFNRGTTLMAVPFDVRKRRIAGTPVAVLEGILHLSPVLPAHFAMSKNGTLIYLPDASYNPTEAFTPLWVDRTGREAGPVVKTPIPALRALQLSPDGKRLLVQLAPAGPQSGAIWVYDLTGRPPVPLIEKGDNASPVWFPDGTRVAFASNKSGQNSFYSLPSDGSTLDPQPLDTGLPPIASGIPVIFPTTWLNDGRLVFTTTRGDRNSSDILAAAPSGSSTPEVLVKTEFNESSGHISPDGRWLAFQWDRTGRGEIWVRAVSGGAPVRVSQNGGIAPLWSHDGRELFFREGSRKVMATAFHAGAVPSFDQPALLFDGPFLLGDGSYDVAADGRFIMIPMPSAPPGAPGSIIVVQNWTEELKRLVPVN